MADQLDNAGVHTMVGLGPKSTQWLSEVGITAASQVRQLGAVECYLRVIGAGQTSPNLNLLWALQGAIEDMHWTLIDPRQRQQLKAELVQRLTQEQLSTKA
jgi:hypothetical protein